MYKKPSIQPLRNPLHQSKGLHTAVMRLDLLHPDISGNKWFKLKHHLSRARSMGSTAIVSFGGAYSNHLVALAVACKEAGFSSTAFVRGDPHTDNASIRQMQQAGMQIIFVSRESYRNKQQLAGDFVRDHPECYVVPEGGGGPDGVKGAAEIYDLIPPDFEYIACAVGTGTTLTGLITAARPDQEIIGVSTLKVPDENNSSITKYVEAHASGKQFRILFDHHFGGYAKKNAALLAFMNAFYKTEGIPSDFVYTGKLFFAMEHLIGEDAFPPSSKILMIHSGGLQGNRSLSPGELIF